MLGKLLDGRYRVINELGSGGFGKTYVAEDTRRMGRCCVVKHLKPENNDPNTLREAKHLFALEANILEKLGNEHAQIPDLLDYFEENQEFYLVQELIEGHPFSTEISAIPPPTEDQVIELLWDVLGVLSFVHKNQVIHRDIKPSNLIRRQKDGRIVLIDFGAVKQVQNLVVNSQGQTTFSRPIGTLGYTPNEQWKGQPRFSSDIYALGMTAIEALTGIPPYKLQKERKTGEIIWRNQVKVSNKLARFLNKMVCFHFRDRYQSVDEVINDLQDLRKSTHKNEKYNSLLPFEVGIDEVIQYAIGYIIGSFALAVSLYFLSSSILAIIPVFVLALLLNWLTNKVVDSILKPIVPAFAIQASLNILALVGGLITNKLNSPLILVEFVMVTVGLIWLVSRPNKSVVILLTLYQISTSLLQLSTVILPKIETESRTVIILMLLTKAVAVALMIKGLKTISRHKLFKRS